MLPDGERKRSWWINAECTEGAAPCAAIATDALASAANVNGAAIA